MIMYHDQGEFIPRMKDWLNTWKSINVIQYSNWIKKEKTINEADNFVGTLRILFKQFSFQLVLVQYGLILCEWFDPTCQFASHLITSSSLNKPRTIHAPGPCLHDCRRGSEQAFRGWHYPFFLTTSLKYFFCRKGLYCYGNHTGFWDLYFILPVSNTQIPRLGESCLVLFSSKILKASQRYSLPTNRRHPKETTTARLCI